MIRQHVFALFFFQLNIVYAMEIPQTSVQDFFTIAKRELETRKATKETEPAIEWCYEDGFGKNLNAVFMEQAIKCAPDEAGEILNGLKSPLEDKSRNLYPRELLFTGAPGTGKTTLGLAFAYVLDYKYRLIDTIQLSNEYKDSGGQNARRSVQSILDEDGNDGWVIIFDEITALTRDHRQEKTDGWKSATALWTLLDKLLLRKNIIVIGTTNDAAEMPTALKSRYSDGVIEFEAPSRDNRKKIIEYWHKHYSYDPSNDSWLCTLGPGALDVFAEKTEDTSIRDLEKLVKRATRICLEDSPNEPVINQNCIDRALQAWHYVTNGLLKIKEEMLTQQERLQRENHAFQKELHEEIIAHQTKLHSEQKSLLEVLDNEKRTLQTTHHKKNLEQQKEIHDLQRTLQERLQKESQELQLSQHQESIENQRKYHNKQLALGVIGNTSLMVHACGDTRDPQAPYFINEVKKSITPDQEKLIGKRDLGRKIPEPCKQQ